MAQLKDLIVTGSSRFLNDINGNITGSAAKLGTSNVGSATKPMYLNAGVPTECTYTLEKSVPSNAVFTDTKVTSVDNHYTPTAASASKITITSTGGYPKKIEISRDAKGHVTAATVTETEVIPDNDFNVTQTEVTTDNNYEVTFSGTASTATKTEGVGKSAGFTYNPSKKSVMEGYNTTASGNYSHAEGYLSTASGAASHAECCQVDASGNYSHAEGLYTIASETASHAEGIYSNASGAYSHAEGSGCLASTQCAHAEGSSTTASASYSHAEGSATKASGNTSHAEGSDTVASNGFAHAEGYRSTASGNTSHAEGYVTGASGQASHAEGYYTQATKAGAHAEGYASSAKPHIASGLGAHVEGYGTTAYRNTASGVGSHAEGTGTVASGDDSHAEGSITVASGNAAHAEGNMTTASGSSSHAEGNKTAASNNYSHAEGNSTRASGAISHAEGYSTTASGAYSHVGGMCTIANHKSQHVFGEYNLADASTAAATARGNYVEIVGNGLSSTQLSNARTLDWDGNEWLAGKLYSSGVVAQSSGTENVRINYYQISVNDTQESHTALWIHSDDIVLPDVQIDQEVYTNTWDGTNSSLKAAIVGKLPLSGGTMTGAITTPTGRWYTGGNYALHLNNSDMIGVNGIWFGDVSSDAGEGLMFPRANGNWDDLYSVDGSLYYCVNRTTAGARGSAYTILHTGNGVLSNGGKYTGGNKTAGYCLHGVGAGHTYACEWTSASKLAFWVDVSNVGTLSDRRLKDDIEPVNMGLVNAIVECESYQYKAFNRGGNISVGIMAQDLVENCKKYNVDPLDYELLCQEKFKEGDPTLYYQMDYDQLLYFKTIYLENKIKELEAKLDSLT